MAAAAPPAAAPPAVAPRAPMPPGPWLFLYPDPDPLYIFRFFKDAYQALKESTGEPAPFIVNLRGEDPLSFFEVVLIVHQLAVEKAVEGFFIQKLLVDVRFVGRTRSVSIYGARRRSLVGHPAESKFEEPLGFFGHGLAQERQVAFIVQGAGRKSETEFLDPSDLMGTDLISQPDDQTIRPAEGEGDWFTRYRNTGGEWRNLIPENVYLDLSGRREIARARALLDDDSTRARALYDKIVAEL